ncbi:MAG: DNA polymerase III subunit delta', partial [Bacteroidetes bacterium]|nr:DNA polymerase III subunit delta' [Bacteroidota bacterium]
LQCEQGGDEACGDCPACAKVGRMVHPDVHVLLPYPSDADPSDVAERLQRIAAHPYAAVDFVRRPALNDPSYASNKQAFYSVGRINAELRQSMSYKPMEGRYKVVVMTDADLMRVAAANTFLKLLEEPGPQTVFILTTSRPDRLLPTILSRCQRLRFDLLPAEAIEKALVERDGVAPGLAAALARMADGSYMRALDLAENEDLMTDRALVVDYLRLSYTQRIDKLADLLDQVGRMGRERVKGLLRLALSWIRDLMLYQTMGDEAALVNVDQAEAVARFCHNVPRADLEAMIRLVEEAVELIERNVHLNLTLTALSQALGRAMRGPHSGKLYVPLAEADAFAVG